MPPRNSCPDGMVVNPKTNRCVKRDGKIGLALYGPVKAPPPALRPRATYEQNKAFLRACVDQLRANDYDQRTLHVYSPKHVLTVKYSNAWAKQVTVALQTYSPRIEKEFAFGVLAGMIPDWVLESRIFYTTFQLSPTSTTSLSAKVLAAVERIDALQEVLGNVIEVKATHNQSPASTAAVKQWQALL